MDAKMTSTTSELAGERAVRGAAAGAGTRIDRPLIGEPLTIGGRTIQPAARLSGWVRSRAGGGAGWLRVQPVEVIVRAADGAEQRTPITDGNAQALRGVVAIGLAVAAVCAGLMTMRRAIARLK